MQSQNGYISEYLPGQMADFLARFGSRCVKNREKKKADLTQTTWLTIYSAI